MPDQVHQSVQCREIIFDSDLYREAICLRDTVLRKPLGFQWRAHDFDAEDVSFHFGAFLGDRLAGTLILRPREEGTLQMRQVAILPEYQSQGIGSALVRFSEKFAVEHGFKMITAHARESALEFYRKLDYKVVGEPFTEVSVTHFEIIKELLNTNGNCNDKPVPRS